MPVKPGRWRPTQAAVDPQYQGFWDGLVKAVPFWDTDDPAQLVNSEVGTLTGGYRIGPVGRETNSDTNGNYVTIPIEGIGKTEGTLLVVFRGGPGSPSAAGKFIASEPDSEIQWFRNSSDTSLAFRLDGAGSSIATSTVWDGATHVMAVTYSSVGNFNEMWIDGVSQGVDTTSLTAISSWTNTDLWIANRQSNTRHIGGGVSLFLAWDRVLSDSELRLLARDPFGMLRPALWPQYPAGGVLTVTLYATGDGTITSVVDELDTTTDMYLSIDDDPAAPTDTDWVNNAIAPGTVQYFPLLTDLPVDFGTADTASIVVRTRGVSWSSGSVTLNVQIFQSDESTSMSDEVAAVTVSAVSSFANTTVAITGVNTTASKTVWDGARLRLRWS